jgi:muramoyltetrapeptide carboxypeptidase
MCLKLLIPAPLSPGDILGIVAPASPFPRDEFARGVAVLKSLGLNIFVPPDLFRRKGYLAGSDHHRARQINRLFADRNIKAMICARGGFGSLRILPLIDYPLIRKNPKMVIGFSDVTALLSALYAKCRLVTFHGPVVTTLADTSEKTRTSFFSAVTQPTFSGIALGCTMVIRSGVAKGAVWGGNLTTLCHLLGTPFLPDFSGHILVLEDRGEQTYRIDRMLTQMRLAGCFDALSGLVLGSFQDCGDLSSIYKIVKNIFSDFSIPIMAGFDIGHGQENIMIPLGISATMDTFDKSLCFHF